VKEMRSSITVLAALFPFSFVLSTAIPAARAADEQPDMKLLEKGRTV